MKVTTTRGVYIDKKLWGFDPSNPEKTNPNGFMILSGSDEDWTCLGYIQVGSANIEIEFFNRDEMTTNAVSTLRKQKESVLAKAQAEATRIDGEIQNLLAITNEACMSDDDNDCPHCDGTGEGMYDGKSCGACRGSGIAKGARDDDDFDEPYADDF